MDYQRLTKMIVELVLFKKEHGIDVTNQMNTIKESMGKYGVSVDSVLQDMGEPADYRKVIFQIITDLRYSMGTNRDLNRDDERKTDNSTLHDIARAIENENGIFDDPELFFFRIGEINYEEYKDIIDEFQLIG